MKKYNKSSIIILYILFVHNDHEFYFDFLTGLSFMVKFYKKKKKGKKHFVMSLIKGFFFYFGLDFEVLWLMVKSYVDPIYTCHFITTVEPVLTEP